MIAKIKTKVQQAQKFLTRDLWLLELKRVPFLPRCGFGMLRILHIVVRDFIRDKCALQAASLTYVILMSMVPILAVAFSVAKGLNAQKMLMDAMAQTIQNLPEQVGGFIMEVFKLVNQTDFATLGAIGILLLFWTVIKVMGQVESTFNQIWGIKTNRTLLRKFSDYTSVLVVVPVLVIVAFTLNASLASKKVTDLLEKVATMQIFEQAPMEEAEPGAAAPKAGTETVVPEGGTENGAAVAPEDGTPAVDAAVAPDGEADSDAAPVERPVPMQVRVVVSLYRMGMRLLGMLGIVAGFTFLYIFLPNTKVKWKSALIGGLFAGLLWIGWQWACINVQMIVTKWNKIYGAFATLPISLFWLNVNWMIALLGAEISFAVQNYQTYVLEAEAGNMTHTSRRRLAYLLVYDICRAFRDGKPWYAVDYQEQYNIPIRLIQDVLFNMEDDRVVVKAEDGAYVPGRDTHHLTLEDVETALNGEPDARTTILSKRLGLRLIDLIGNHDSAYHKALDQRSFADLLESREAESEESPG